MAERQIHGGAKLAAALDRIARKLSTGGTVKVGFLAGATYPDGTPVAMVAAIQDFGAPSVGIPPRPFFRNMVREKSPGWPEAVKNLVASEDYDTRKILMKMGEGIAGQLRQSIVDTNEPPLAPATIARKGFDKPLISTGHLLESIDYEVSDM